MKQLMDRSILGKMDNLLLVEGKDDLHIVRNLMSVHDVPETFSIIESGGESRIFSRIPILVKTDITIFGIILDADIQPWNKWTRLKALLENAGYGLPDKPEQNGTIVKAEGKPIVGIWMMPDNMAPGKIEDFLLAGIPSDDHLILYAKNSVALIETNNVNLYKKSDHSKALLHTWLAWQEKPGLPPGTAVMNSKLFGNTQLQLSLIDWINKLFNESLDH